MKVNACFAPRVLSRKTANPNVLRMIRSPFTSGNLACASWPVTNTICNHQRTIKNLNSREIAQLHFAPASHGCTGVARLAGKFSCTTTLGIVTYALKFELQVQVQCSTAGQLLSKTQWCTCKLRCCGDDYHFVTAWKQEKKKSDSS